MVQQGLDDGCVMKHARREVALSSICGGVDDSPGKVNGLILVLKMDRQKTVAVVSGACARGAQCESVGPGCATDKP